MTLEVTTQTSHSIFPFLQLPRELRDMIYDLALDLSHPLSRTDQKVISSESWYNFPKELGNRRRIPGILLLNRQVHHEAINNLYDKTFVLNRGCDPRVLMEYFTKGFLQKLRHVKMKVDLTKDLYGFGSHQTWADMFRLLYPVWQQTHSLQSLELDLPIISRPGFLSMDEQYLAEYVALVVVPLNLLKKEINKMQPPTNLNNPEPFQPIKVVASQEALLAITLDCDLLQPENQNQVREVLYRAAHNLGNLEKLAETHPGWRSWWNSEKNPRTIKNTFGVLAFRRGLGSF
jgi:hypothetical protein